MSATAGSGGDRTGPVTIAAWAQQRYRGTDVVTASEPEPILLDHNAIAVSRDPASARAVVLAWERILDADAAVGFVALGARPTEPRSGDEAAEHGADGVAGHAAGRSLRGGIPGAVIGAVVVAAIVAILDGWSTTLIGAALGGAAFGFVAGAMGSFVKGTGWGAAYIDSFVDDEDTEVLLASIHADDVEPIERALEAAHGIEAIEIYVVDRAGGLSPTR